MRVCKESYLSSIDRSQRRIERFHDKAARNEFTDKRVKHTKSRTTDDARTFIREHIESFPGMPSHYCRASSSKEYLAPDLNLSKMYNLYVEKCAENDVVPVKSHMYRNIFNTEFNLGYHVPKKYRCDQCMEYQAETDANKVTRTLQEKFDAHQKDKSETREERESDRKLTNKQRPSFVLIRRMS